MPTSYGGNDTFPTTANLPSGGDTRNAQSVNVPLEALFDRTKFLKVRWDLLAGVARNAPPGQDGTYNPGDVGTVISSTVSTSFADLLAGDSLQVTFANLKSGDVVLVYAQFYAAHDAAGNGYVRIGNLDAPAIALHESRAFVPNADPLGYSQYSCMGFYNVTQTMTNRTFNLQAKTDAAGTVKISKPAMMVGLVFRP